MNSIFEGNLFLKKGVSKSGAIFQKVCQKVAHFSEKGVKKWRTFSKSASKSDTPIKISGVLGDFAPN